MNDPKESITNGAFGGTDNWSEFRSFIHGDKEFQEWLNIRREELARVTELHRQQYYGHFIMPQPPLSTTSECNHIWKKIPGVWAHSFYENCTLCGIDKEKA